VRASLADQGGAGVPSSLAIALGANLPSAAGGPEDTLRAVRPLLSAALPAWLIGLEPTAASSPQVWSPGRNAAGPGRTPLRLHWSPLFRTAPLGGPPGQPDYLNAVLLLQPLPPPALTSALAVLNRLQELEQRFQRQRGPRWGPRSLDLDLLWWGELRADSPQLQLPHPRWRERAFVLAPLLAIEAALAMPIALPGPPQALPALLRQVRRSGQEVPLPLPPREGWPE
jgi:2-amino-4-hydroxy-6-hydroxymethyldihydropteridine diphosphokinase